jgi:hypothetical protein
MLHVCEAKKFKQFEGVSAHAALLFCFAEWKLDNGCAQGFPY